ncbi:MAG: TonB-dependent receptor family protein [Sphingomonadales bacterium]
MTQMQRSAWIAAPRLSLLSTTAIAQGIGQRLLDLEEIKVQAINSGTLTAPSAQERRERLIKIPGAIGFVEASEFLDGFAQSLGDTLVFTPGVFADTSAQRENRISIRGSGLNSAFERRGITVLRDGVPITRASGSTEFQEIDPLSIQYLEVLKGANGMQVGAASLGGAINVITPTGRTVKDPYFFRFEGGSFETLRANARVAHAGETVDFYAGVTGLFSEGFRDHSDVNSVYGFTNVGIQLSERLETRFYITALSDNFELAGSLTLDEIAEDPTQTQPAVEIGPFFPGGPTILLAGSPEQDDWDRNLDVIRVSNKTALALDTMTLEGGAWVSYRKLDHAITRFAGIIDQEEWEYGLFGRAGADEDDSELGFGWSFGFQANVGSNAARNWENDFGERGDLSTDNDQDSANILAYLNLSKDVFEDFTVVATVQYNWASRDNDVILDDPATNGRLTFDQISPRLGFVWTLEEDYQVYANVSRGFEPPALVDLTAGGAFPFTELEAQTSWTAEIGTRGQLDWVSWDVTYYRSWVENEFLDFAVEVGENTFVTATSNAGDTIHQGIELGADFELYQKDDMALVWRHVYTLNAFNFDNDPDFGNNRLPGVPRHAYTSELRLASEKGWFAGVNVRWIPDGPFVDSANQVAPDGYALWGFNLGYRIDEAVQLYLSGENLADKTFVANTGVTDAAQITDRLFTPGQGRALFGGVTISF